MPNNIGAYGDWAAGLAADPPRLSFRQTAWQALLRPDSGGIPRANVRHHIEFDGLAIEYLKVQHASGPDSGRLRMRSLSGTAEMPI